MHEYMTKTQPFKSSRINTIYNLLLFTDQEIIYGGLPDITTGSITLRALCCFARAKQIVTSIVVLELATTQALRLVCLLSACTIDVDYFVLCWSSGKMTYYVYCELRDPDTKQLRLTHLVMSPCVSTSAKCKKPALAAACAMKYKCLNAWIQQCMNARIHGYMKTSLHLCTYCCLYCSATSMAAARHLVFFNYNDDLFIHECSSTYMLT